MLTCQVLALSEADSTPLREKVVAKLLPKHKGAAHCWKDLDAIFDLVDYDDSGIVEIEAAQCLQKPSCGLQW